MKGKTAQAIDKIENLCIFSKNSKLEYTCCNEQLAEAAGLDSPNQIIGKTDHDLIWFEQAELYHKRDHLVLKGHRQNNQLGHQQTTHKLRQVLTTKNPIKNAEGDIVGIAGFFTEVTEQFPFVSDIHITEKGKLALGSYFGNKKLSKREFELLLHLLRGTRLPKILEKMGIKKSTYDTFTERLKNKMGCSTIGEVNYASLKSGISYLFL